MLKRYHDFGITAIKDILLKWEHSFEFQFVIVVVLKTKFIYKGKRCNWLNNCTSQQNKTYMIIIK